MKNHKNIKLSGGFLCISSPKSLGHLSSQGPEKQTNELIEAPEMSLWGMVKNDVTYIESLHGNPQWVHLFSSYLLSTYHLYVFCIVLGTRDIEVRKQNNVLVLIKVIY